MRIFGVEVPDNKKVPYALAYIYGIGIPLAMKIVWRAQVDSDKRMGDINEEELNRIIEVISKDVEEHRYKIEGDLRREILANVKRLQMIHCYRGDRHNRRLPVRGQRTHTNARTRKGARKTVGVVSSAKK
jgi:small subunit ribosomal protein S13